jgi:hypothetical protein
MIITGVGSQFSPIRQAIACAFFAIVGMVLCHYIFRGGTYEFMAAFCGIMFYSIMNPVVSIFYETFAKYTWPSWGLFIALTVLLLLFARLISGVSIWNLAEYRMMITSILFFYIVSSLIVRLIRMIWEYAESDEN